MGNIGFGEILILVLVVLILFGPNKLPEVGKALGKAIGEFRRGIRDGMVDDRDTRIDKTEKTDPNSTPTKLL